MIDSKIKRLREQNHMLLFQQVLNADIDTTLLCKMELGERLVIKEDIIQFGKILNVIFEECISLWKLDKINRIGYGEEKGIQGIDLMKAWLMMLQNRNFKNQNQ